MLFISPLTLPSLKSHSGVCFAPSATEEDQEHFTQSSRCSMKTASHIRDLRQQDSETHINRVLMAELLGCQVESSSLLN